MVSDLNQMLVFVGVVDGGGFTAAARALGMPKSTVSKRIAELEDRLGVLLLHRSTRRVNLTADGVSYYAECRRIVDDARAADRAISQRDGSLRGLVRVTVPWLLEEVVAPVFEKFLEAHAGVSLDLHTTNRRVDLIGEGVDLAIRTGSLPDSALVARRLGEVVHCICASPSYLDRHGAVTRPSELRDHACICFRGRGERQTWTFERGGKKSGVVVSSRYWLSSGALMRRAAIAGLGIANLPEFLVADDVATGRLVRLLDPWTTGRGSVQLVYPSGRHLSPSVRALLDLLGSTFASDPPWTRRAPQTKARGRRDPLLRVP